MTSLGAIEASPRGPDDAHDRSIDLAAQRGPGSGCLVEIPDTHYAVTPDGVYLAYQVFGEGPIDVVWLSDWPGNIDLEWEDPLSLLWFDQVTSFARVILHDRRGVGLSSRNVALPNLETRASDLLAVLDAAGSDHPVLVGVFESGAPGALLAATKPERVHSLVWLDPNPRFAWAPDFPWGRTQADMDAELRDIEHWGTRAYGQAFQQDEAARGNVMPDFYAALMARWSRNACTPDVARALSRIWYETDVRGVLPAVRVPTLVLSWPARERDIARSRYVASLIPGAELREMPGDGWSERDMVAIAEEIRGFVGVGPATKDLDRVLAAVLFTDIVGSTEHLSRLGDAGWGSVLARHDERAKVEIDRHRGRHVDSAGDGIFATFDGPARAVRCAQAIGASVRDLGIQIRAGVHTGEVELDGDHVRGIAVHIGARVGGLAGPSEILVSQTVRDLVAGSGLAFEDAGEHELKGVSDPWHLYRVVG
jgi:class 3 adenylate cyclase/pimeloyl-ACP methyl ester carboxylesterase